MREEIPKIAIDGGPGSGKTTVMATAVEKLSDFGFKVFVVPEAATIIINSGFDPRVFKDEDEILRIQEAIFNTQLHLEQQCTDTAEKLKLSLNGQKPLLLCDRGIIGAKAYFPERCSGYFETLIKFKGLEISEVMNSYRGVIHLVTAADGAEQFYTLENNKARRENLEEARIIDKRIKDCWIGHPHLKVVDNSTDFEGKKKRVLAAICRFLDIPAPMEIERKFLVKKVDVSKMPKHQKIDIEQLYLASDDKNEEIRLRKRGYNGSFSYFLTKKIKTSDPTIRYETERIISHYEFLALSNNYDKSKSSILKDRVCFLHNNQYFELDFFKKPDRLKNLIVLEIELTEQNDKVEVPDWIQIEKEVTDDPTYSNFNLASY